MLVGGQGDGAGCVGLLAVGLGGPVLGLVAFAVALFGGVALVVRRARKARRPPPLLRAVAATGATTCPSCLREFPQGTLYCSHDARKLVSVEEVTERRSAGVRCPRCRRAFEAGTRYCPLDAEELMPQSVWEATHAHTHDHDHDDPDGTDSSGKICPVCAAKYGLEATFCGKDGSELVTVN